MKTNVTYIISNIKKAIAFEWIALHLNKDKFKLSFILLNSEDSELEKFMRQQNIPVDRIYYKNKKDIPKAIFSTYKILKRDNIQIIHTHLFEANLIGLSAAWLACVPKRIQTRHHSNYHHIYYPKAVKFDKLANYLSTHIIAPSKVVQDILINEECAGEQKVYLIHHGFQLNDFENVLETSLNKNLKLYNPNKLHPVIGLISRYTEWKGIQYIIPAFKKLLELYPNALLILANANGDYKDRIKQLLKDIPSKNYIEILFEEEIFSLYKLFDIFVHAPISPEVEAFGQTYVEALASEIPSIFTLSGIANEFIIDHHNALVVPYENSDAIYNAMIELLEKKSLTTSLIFNGKKDVNQRFSLDKMIRSLEKLYER